MSELARNRRARYDYEILKTYEAGIALLGHEVKAIKAGKIALNAAYVRLKPNGNRPPTAELMGAEISPYQPKNTPAGFDPGRTRRLLLHASELQHMSEEKQAGNLTLIPVSVYTKRGKIKVAIALARGRQQFDKRRQIKKRELDRTVRNAMKHSSRSSTTR